MVDQGLKRLFYQRLRDFIYHIPGENPSAFTLCGTNCFVVGQGNSRVMIEAGDYPESNQLFLENFTKFLNDFHHVRIQKIFITHAHHDHFGGLYDVLNILFQRGHSEPLVYKKLDGNKFEQEVFTRYPQLVDKVHDLKHNDLFHLEEDKLTMRALYTPGHATDHFSMLMTPDEDREGDKENFLFSGDIILGTPSTSVQELKSYMDTLYALRDEKFEHICLPHAQDNLPDSIIVQGKPKLEAYIKYREDRDRAILLCFKERDQFEFNELYDAIYGSRGLTGGLKEAAINNLGLHLEKLVIEGLLNNEDGKFNRGTEYSI